MSIGISKEKLLEVVGGRSVGAGRIFFQGVEFDSRQVKGGELFLALKGESGHGHAFVDQALSRGAALCLVEDPAMLEGHPEAARLVAVEDALSAFHQLAAWWRRELKVPVVGITGSMGKTTVKELTACILLKHSRGLYSFKSFNNHTGVPYTLCGAGPEHRWVVLEMGMNHPGELTELSRMAAPDAAALINVGTVHTHVFESVDAIADAKAEIMAGLAPGGALIINGDDPRIQAAVSRRDPQGGAPLKRVGWGEGCAARLLAASSKGLAGITCRMLLDGEELELVSPLLGRHNAYNIAAAALIARTLVPEVSAEQIKSACAGFIAPRMRLNLRRVAPERILVDDTYNANPPAMRALFELAGEVQAAGQRIGLVLGDMRELGARAPEFHREVAQAAAALKPDFIVAVGEYAGLYTEAGKPFGLKVFEAASPVAAAHVLHKLPFNVVFIKASRGIGLDKTVETLLEIEGEMPPERAEPRGLTPIRE